MRNGDELGAMAFGAVLGDERRNVGHPKRHQTLRIGIVGLGHGLVVAQQVLATGRASLAALCVKDPYKNAQKIEYLRAPVYTSIDVLLDEAKPDGVIVAASTDCLAPIAERCIERGVPVLLEKPAARDVAEIGRLQSAGQTTSDASFGRVSPQILRSDWMAEERH
ncbi:Gfo/Idh/MocA family protein [Bradyrhizobium neotropicale]|uniref:Gfo/Idh/MocA family protein n=1 Tax=Bradyrhizobium neotropicale TaxID=1497615 RepID=UPI001AD688FA|nr:Gfo/Idh/MocA family oxidoreductase [Bradyrhizobium neotropicale]MBO4228412.1 Gfo/Idh/MocA family oxidoreductase [Bradyrhizobium neotropicale]